MSLVSWFPLKGDVVDRVNGDIFENSSSATFAENAVFGESLYSSSSIISFIYPSSISNKIFNTNYFSISFWINVPSTSSGACRIFGNDAMSAQADLTCRIFSFFQYPSKNDFHWSFQNSNASGYASNIIYGCLPDDIWTHVCVTYNGSKALNVYINGEKKYTTTLSQSINYSTFNYKTYAFVQSPLRQLSDLRVYNHCLSVKEVKELSKGLLLRYSFDGLNINKFLEKSVGNWLFNTTSSSLSYDITDDKYTVVSNYGSNVSAAFGSAVAINYMNVPYGYTYRVSADVFIPSSYSLAVDTNNKSVTGSSWNGNDNDLNSSRFYTLSVTAGKWSHIYWGSKNAHSSNTNKYDLQVYDGLGIKTSSATGSITWYIKNLKFELSNENTNTTDFCPKIIDNTLYDESGFDFNGTVKGNVYSSSNDNPPGTYWDGNCANAFYCAIFPRLQIFTYSVWIKTTSANNMHFLGNGRDYNTAKGCSMAIISGYPRVYAGAITVVASKTVNDGKYHMITVTSDSSYNIKLYIDGVLNNSGNNGKLLSWDDVANHAFLVGKMAFEYTSDTTYFPFIGDIADVRVYHTALSDDDILQLYQVKKSISNTGALFVNKIDENPVNSLSVLSHSVQKAKKFNEILMLEDGSMWLQLLHHDLRGAATGNRFTSAAAVRNSNVYLDENRWSCFPLINSCDHGDVYEFLVFQQANNNGAIERYRWSQTINPYNASYNTTVHSSITPIENISNAYGGMYPGTSAIGWIFNNSVNGNWNGCGDVTPYLGGLPGYIGATVKGIQDVYIRIYSMTYSERKGDISVSAEINNN